MKYKDYYKVLGVERTAGEDEIKKAYRKLARKYCCQMVKPLRATSGRIAKAMTHRTFARCDILM